MAGFTSLNRWFRSSCTTEGSASLSFASFSNSQAVGSSSGLSLGAQSLVGRIYLQQKWKGPIHSIVSAQCELCLHPTLELLKSLLAVKFCNFFPPFSPSILASGKPNSESFLRHYISSEGIKKSYSFLIHHLTLWYKYRLKNETKEQSAFVHSRITDGNWGFVCSSPVHKTSHSLIFTHSFITREKEKICFMVLIWKDIYCGSNVQMGICLHEKPVGPQKTPFMIWSK